MASTFLAKASCTNGPFFTERPIVESGYRYSVFGSRLVRRCSAAARGIPSSQLPTTDEPTDYRQPTTENRFYCVAFPLFRPLTISRCEDFFLFRVFTPSFLPHGLTTFRPPRVRPPCG